MTLYILPVTDAGCYQRWLSCLACPGMVVCDYMGTQSSCVYGMLQATIISGPRSQQPLPTRTEHEEPAPKAAEQAANKQGQCKAPLAPPLQQAAERQHNQPQGGRTTLDGGAHRMGELTTCKLPHSSNTVQIPQAQHLPILATNSRRAMHMRLLLVLQQAAAETSVSLIDFLQVA